MEKDTKKETKLNDYFTEEELNNFRKHLTDEQIKELLQYFYFDTLACIVWFQKYADVKDQEVHPNEMHIRLAEEFYKVEQKYIKQELEYIKNNIIQEDEKKEFSNAISEYGFIRNVLRPDDIYGYMADFSFIIPQGSVMSQLGTEELGSLSNCFVVDSPKDSYGGILKTDEELVQIAKRRGGVGVDISTLRPMGSPTSNVAKTSTGAVSFMERFSNSIREVAQGGRRGALMITISVEHPDIQEFITIKNDLTKVTGANISVKISDSFMTAVNEGKEYCLRWPIDSKPIDRPDGVELNTLYTPDNKTYFKWVNANKLWDDIVTSAHKSGEPGVLFWSKVLTHSPDGVYSQYRPQSTNPCGEIPIPVYDSCRLIAMNLLSFVRQPFTDKSEFDFDLFYKTTYEAARLGDDLVDLELEAVQKIIDKIKSDPEDITIKQRELDLWENIYEVGKSGRRIGLGLTALGDTAAALDIRYGDDRFKKFFKKLMKTKLRAELDCTIDLALLRGTFKGYNLRDEYYEIEDKYYGANSFFQMLLDEFPEQAKRMIKYGRRNISWSTIAPTGSLSILAQVTSGIEPLFQPYYVRRKKIIGDSDITPDFIDDNGDKWTEHLVIHDTFKTWCKYKKFPTDTEDDLKFAFKNSPWYNATADKIDWVDRVKVQAIAQRYTTHSISSTVNLPKEATINDVKIIYDTAFKENLKGITIYRDGSRDGVLITKSSNKNEEKFTYKNAIKRPKEVEAEAFTTTIHGEKYSIFVGFMNGLPYEVFAYKGSTKEGKGKIVKIEKGNYQFIGDGEDSRHRIITGKMTDEQEIIARLISGSLRHGRDIRFIVEDLLKTSGTLFSFNSAIARILKRFIKNGVKAKEKCPQCGDENNMVYEEGCLTCKSCGYSKCG